MLHPVSPRRAFPVATIVLLLGLPLGAAGIDPGTSQQGLTNRREARGQGEPAPSANPVWSVAWSPDGERFASGGYDGLVRFWGPDGSEGPVLSGHHRAVTCVAWSPDGKRLAWGSQDGTVRLWALDGTSELILKGHTGYVASVAWGPDGRRLATASDDRTVRLWRARGKQGPVLKGHGGTAHSVAWGPDGKRVVSGGMDGTLRLWRPGKAEARWIKDLSRVTTQPH